MVIGRINVKIGARVTSGICMIGAGLSYIYWGHTETLFTYGIGLTLVTSFINGAAYIAGGALIAQWFQRRRDWSTDSRQWVTIWVPPSMCL